MTDNRSLIDIAQAAQSKKGHQAPEVSTSRITTDNTQADALKELLRKVDSKTAWVDVTLPSKGLIAGTDSTVQIRPFTFEDEKILRTVQNANQASNTIKVLMNRTVKGVEYEKLTLADKTYLLFKLREISYGNDYPVDIECPQCNFKNSLNIEINKLPVKYLEDSGSLENKVVLPDSEVEVEYRFPMADDDASLTDIADMMDNLWRFIVSVDGHESRMVIQGFIPKTSGKDVLTLQKKIFGTEFGLQTKVNFFCEDCKADSEIELPLTASFFNVN